MVTKKNKDSLSRRRLSDKEKNYIRQNCMDHTDEELARNIGRNVRTVTAFRKKMGIFKVARGKVMNLSLDKNERLPSVQSPVSKRMTHEEKANWFTTQFMNTSYFNEIKKQLTEIEIETYLQEWGALCAQFEDIVATEKRQIDELIKVQILDNRLLRNIKIIEDEINTLVVQIEKLRAEHDVASDERLQELDTKLMDMVQNMSYQAKNMNNDHLNFIKMKNSMLAELNARRKDRIDAIRHSKTTFVGLVEMLQDQSVRDAQSKRLGLVKMSMKKKQDEFRKPTMFPDGTFDPILIDSETPMISSQSDIIQDLKARAPYNPSETTKELERTRDNEQVEA